MNAIRAVEMSEDVVSVETLDHFVARRWADWHRLAFVVTGNREDAADAVQEALAGLYPKWDRIRSGNPEAYVRRSITNAHINAYHKSRRTTAHENLDQWGLAASDYTESVDNADLAVKLFRRLKNPRQRQAVILRFYEDLDYDEIAEICQTSPAAVRSLIRQALQTMRAVISARN
jgi:RNA polymerase sigma factor (sigma-70 family)